jgi:hypothetical protein
MRPNPLSERAAPGAPAAPVLLENKEVYTSNKWRRLEMPNIYPNALFSLCATHVLRMTLMVRSSALQPFTQQSAAAEWLLYV